MKYLLLILPLLLSGCGDVSITTTSDGGQANATPPVIVQPVVVQ